VGDAVFDKLAETTDDLEEIVHGPFFVKTTSLCVFEIRSKRPFFCQLEDDVKIVDCFVDIVELDDIGTLELLVDLDLAVECVFGILVLHKAALVDHLDSNLSLRLFFDS
jgi:hypothetical protein